ncbi:MAG: hypothetical protein JWM43_452 [Acidobacteriaceae bacterium]|nr:hypothetical protein [Acidobacteriaceae bacterium]
MQGSVYLYFGHTLLTQGSFADLARLGIEPKNGLRLSFYDLDADNNDRPTYLCAEGNLYQSEDGRWHASVDKESFRTVLRSEVVSH